MPNTSRRRGPYWWLTGNTPVEMPHFAGLDLRNDPQEVGLGGALDAMNVTLTPDERLSTRDGYTSWATGLAAPVVVMRQITAAGSVAVGANSQFKIFNSAGALVSTDVTNPQYVGDVASLAVAGTARTFEVATGSTPMRWWDGAAFANGAAITGQRLCVTPWDSRLVATGPSTAAVTSIDRVSFSDPGTGQIFGANNWVDLNPGDGESIVAAVSWRELVFVFKQNKFFVFYGTSIDGSGNPIFNYRTNVGIGAINPGQGLPSPKTHVVAVGRDGVYFLANDGVYVTTGGVPQRISKPLDAWFRGDTLPYLSSIPTNIGLANSVVGVVGDRVYVCPNNTQALTFVYNITTGTWTAYNWAFDAICSHQINAGIPTALLAIGTSIFKHSHAATTDAGVAIASRYRTGFWTPPGRPRQDGALRVRGWALDGSGVVTVKTAVSDLATLGAGAAVTLGTAPAVVRKWDRRAGLGTNFSLELSGGAPWSVSRVIAHLQ